MVLDDVAVSPVAPLSGDMVGISSLVFFAGGALFCPQLFPLSFLVAFW